MAKSVKHKSNVTVGYTRLPGHVSEGSHAHWNKTFTASSRTSMADIINRFQEVISGMKGACPDSLEAALMPTFDKAQKYCPVDTGALVESGELTSGVNADGSAYSQIAFGDGGRIHYASMVHERTDLHHEAPTRSKWLQAAVEEDMHLLKRRFAKAVKRIMGLQGGNV